MKKTIKEKLQTAITFTVVITTMGTTAYFYAKYSNLKNVKVALESELNNKEGQIAILHGEIQDSDLDRKQQEEFNEFVSRKKYSLADIIAMTANIVNECDFTKYRVRDRCDVKESYTIAYTAMNLLQKSLDGKANYGKTLEEVIYHKNPQTGAYLYSWVPKVPVTKELIRSERFNETLKIVYEVLGNSPEIAKYNYGQEYYCREDINPCTWHKSATASGKLVYLGRINLDESEEKQFFITAQSFHTFYKENYKTNKKDKK